MPIDASIITKIFNVLNYAIRIKISTVEYEIFFLIRVVYNFNIDIFSLCLN